MLRSQRFELCEELGESARQPADVRAGRTTRQVGHMGGFSEAVCCVRPWRFRTPRPRPSSTPRRPVQTAVTLVAIVLALAAGWRVRVPPSGRVRHRPPCPGCCRCSPRVFLAVGGLRMRALRAEIRSHGPISCRCSLCRKMRQASHIATHGPQCRPLGLYNQFINSWLNS